MPSLVFFGDDYFFVWKNPLTGLNEYPTFNHQHTPILLDSGNLIIFDNGGIHPGDSFISKCQEYLINNNSFELVWEYT